MVYRVSIVNNNEYNQKFGKYREALDYCEVVSRLFCIPLILFSINDKKIESYKIQNIAYRGNVRGIN